MTRTSPPREEEADFVHHPGRDRKDRAGEEQQMREEFRGSPHQSKEKTTETSAVGSPARPPATRPGGKGVVVVVYVVLAVVVVVTSGSGGSIICTIVPSRLFHFLNR